MNKNMNANQSLAYAVATARINGQFGFANDLSVARFAEWNEMAYTSMPAVRRWESKYYSELFHAKHPNA